MKYLWLAVLLLVFSPLAFAQDPLGAGFKPVMDTTCSHYPTNVWVSGPLWKIRQDAGTAPTCTDGMAENGKWGTFYGTQNEFVDFQVHWHDTGAGTTGLKITVSNFTQAAPNTTTPISCATGIGEKCIVYREQYMHVTFPDCTGSPAGYCYNVAGFYPDILEPTVDPYWGQTTNAWPFTVAANQNQSAWIDVLIPSAAQSGYYSGTVTVQTGCPGACTTVATLPITIGVWEWPGAGSMPSKPTLKSYFAQPWFNQQCQAFFGSTSCAGYPINGTPGFNATAATTAAALDECITLMDHRVGCNGESDQYSSAGIFGTTANFTSTYSPILNGTSTAPHPLTLLTGAATTSWNWTANGIPTAAQQSTAGNLFSTNGWLPEMFYYFCDEKSCTPAVEQSTGSTLHSQTPPISTFTTDTGITSVTSRGSLNAIDIIVADIRFDDPPSAYTSWLAGNCCGVGSPVRQAWGYQTCDDGAGPCTNGQTGTGTFPGYSVDNTPATNQAMEWFSYKNGKSGELYFAVSICPAQPAGQNCGANGFPANTGNPLVSNYHQGMWGDGTMLYEVPASTWGVTTPIFIPSMRLKYVRDGMQNYEYMNVLKQNGKDSTVVQPAISSWITNVTTVNWNSTAPAFGFTSDLQDARIVLGNAMHALTTFSSCTAPWCGIIAPSRAVDWSKAGVLDPATGKSFAAGGGIPDATWTQCTTPGTIAAYTGTAAQINSAIASCSGSNQYVLLGPGTFTLSTGITFGTANHVELRGAGSDLTFILMNGQDACGGNNAGICIGNGIDPQNAATQPRSSNAADLTGTVEGGTDSYPANAQGLLVANIGSAGGGIHQNQFITVDQAGAGTTGPGLNDCTDFSIQNNACLQDNASTGNRIVPSSIGVGVTVTVVVSGGTTVTLTPATGQNATFSTAWVNMPSTVYLGGPGGTPTSVVIQSVQTTTSLTLANPGVANGSYSMSLYSPVAGTLTQSTGAFVATTGATFTQAYVGQAMDLMANNTLFPVRVASVTDTTHLTFAATPALPVDGTYAIKSFYHAQSQIVQVTGLSGTGCTGTSPNIVCTGAGPFTLTVSPGLYGPNWSALKGPGIWFGTWPEANYDGVSDLSMDLTNSTNAVNGVLFLNANNSWVKNYRSINGITSHIEFIGSAHNTIQSCYLYGTRNASTQSYGVEHFNGSDNLIHNCIGQHISSGTIIGHSFGTVFANNYFHDNFGPAYNNATITATSQSGTTRTYTFSGLANAGKPLSACLTCPISVAGTTNGGGVFNVTNLLMTSASSGTSGTFTVTVPNSATIPNASEANAIVLASGAVMNTALWMHDPGVNYTLFEGNIAAGTFGDAFHGHANADTWYRNYLTGYESNKNSAIIAAKITPLSRYHNFIGNLFGDNQTSYKGLFSSIYYLAPENLTQDAQVLADPLVNSTSMFWGNYDTVSAAIRWCGNSTNPGWGTTCASTSEVPTVDSFGYANPVPASLTLPVSFWNTTAPFYNLTPQGTVPTPTIGSDVTANATGVGIAIAPDLVVPANLAPANHAWMNAAENCYYHSAIDSNYPLGMDRGVLLFSAPACYGTTGPNPVNPPTFAPPSGTFTSAQSVIVSTTTAGATICYTQDGTTPTTNGAGVCTGATLSGPAGTSTVTVSVLSTQTINAVGTKSGLSDSSIQSALYTITSVPQATLTPSSIFLGNQNINTTSAVFNATYTNTGSVPVSVSSVVVAGNFSRATPTSGTPCVGTSFTLAVGASCTIGVTFTPTATIAYNRTLTVTDSSGTSPHVTTLTGQGTQPVIQWTPSSVNYGNVTVGQVLNSPSLQLTNTGTGTLTISSLVIGGTNPSVFSIFSNTCPSTLAAGASCNVVVRFAPIAVQAYSATLTVTDSIQSISGAVALSGAGFIPPATPSAPLPVIIE